MTAQLERVAGEVRERVVSVDAVGFGKKFGGREMRGEEGGEVVRVGLRGYGGDGLLSVS